MGRWKGDSLYYPLFITDPEKIVKDYTILVPGTTLRESVTVDPVIDNSEETQESAPSGTVIYVKKAQILGDLKNEYLDTDTVPSYITSLEELDDETILEVTIKNVFLGMSQNQLNNYSLTQIQSVSGFYYGYRRTYYLQIDKSKLEPILFKDQIPPRIDSVIQSPDSLEITLVGPGLVPAGLVKFEYPNGVVKYADIPVGSGTNYYFFYQEQAERVLEERQEYYREKSAEEQNYTLWRDLESSEQTDLESLDLNLIGGPTPLDYETARLAILTNFGKDIDDIEDPGFVPNGIFILRYLYPLGEEGEYQKRAIYVNPFKLQETSEPRESLYYSVEWF